MLNKNFVIEEITYGTDLMQRRTWEWGIRRYRIESDDSRVIVLSLRGVEWVILAYSLEPEVASKWSIELTTIVL